MSSGLTLPFNGSTPTGPAGVAFAITNLTAGSAVTGTSSGPGLLPGVPSIGVQGVSNAEGAIPGVAIENIGVQGVSSSGPGVDGESTNGDGVFGQGRNGVHGRSASQTDSGVWGENTGSGVGVAGSTNSLAGPLDSTAAGVWGSNAGSGIGVKGSSNTGTGVHGKNGTGLTIFEVPAAGVLGASDSAPGVYGTSNSGIAVEGLSGSKVGVFGQGGAGGVVGLGSPAITGLGGPQAASFVGVVSITGDLKVTGNKQFQIDHPLDPANKILNHNCVESSEAKNVYDGTILLDARGEAMVELPAWCEALNTDFRYQVTPLGKYAPLFIASKLRNNRFTIAGGEAGMEVSWQVTGVRQDAYAKAHPVPVEEDKSAEERGYYLQPTEHGAANEKGILRVRYPALMRIADEAAERRLHS